jgi:branched-chain amino acid transport system substrate-binding protein
VKRLCGRRTALALCLAAAAATTMGVSRCGKSKSSVTVSGSTLTIYASAPSAGTAAAGADVLDAERLALSQAGARAGRFAIRLGVLDRKPSDNARTAIQDTSAIAYLGELQPGASADSIGITEDQDLLQVTPTDTAIALTQTTPAVPGAPKSYYEQFDTYGRTFARVVPSGAAEARAQVSFMRSLGVHKLYVADDGSDYGKAIAYAVRQDASSALSVVTGPPTATGFNSSGADALFFGAASPSGQAGRLFATVAEGSPRPARLFAPSALDSQTFASSFGPAKLNLYISSPGFPPKKLPAAAMKQFVKPFEAAYGHAPSTEAIFGYEAMAAVLEVLREAGAQANNRTTVVHDFFALKDRQSVLGRYSLDSNGDPSIAPFTFSRVRDGVLVPVR